MYINLIKIKAMSASKLHLIQSLIFLNLICYYLGQI